MKKISFEEAEVVAREYPIDEFLTKENFKKEILDQLNPQAWSGEKADFKFGKTHKNKIPCKCPFHKTNNNDSTSLLLESNRIYCFVGGCPAGKTMTRGKEAKGLNVVSMYMILKLNVNYKLLFTPAVGTEYKEAVTYLAELQGFTVEKRRGRVSSQEMGKIRVSEILRKTAELYHAEFLRNQVAQNYFLEEEFETERTVFEKGEKIIKKEMKKGRAFKYASVDVKELIQHDLVGYAPNSFPSTWLYDQLAKEYTTEEILASGVVKMISLKDNQKGSFQKAVDFHSEALIIPYLTRGKVTNIYSRAIFASDKKWRHLRLAGSVDEPINFDEGSRNENVNICEGELSLESLKALAYSNSLGNRGTNGLKEEHVELLLKRREESGGVYCKTIYLIYDGDKAGKDATINSGELLIAHGFDVRVVMLPDGMDPNDLLTKYKENAKAIFDKLYTEALSFYTFAVLYQMDSSKNSASELLIQYREAKKKMDEYDITSEVELMIIAKEYANFIKVPVDIILKEWKPKENKQIEVFTSGKYVFMTKDLESYYLTKTKFNSNVSFVEDTDFAFIDGTITLRSMVIDGECYDEEEQKNIQFFCDLNGIKFFSINGFKEIYKMSSENMMGSLLKN